MNQHEYFIARNAIYADRFTKGDLPMRPARGYVVVTCMDARVEPLSQLGILLGDAHVIRNAGGRVTEDVIESIKVSQQRLGTREIALFRHTNCGMYLSSRFEQEAADEDKPGREEAIQENSIKIRTFSEPSQEEDWLGESLEYDAKLLKDDIRIREGTVITGWVYDVTQGRIRRLV